MLAASHWNAQRAEGPFAGDAVVAISANGDRADFADNCTSFTVHIFAMGALIWPPEFGSFEKGIAAGPHVFVAIWAHALDSLGVEVLDLAGIVVAVRSCICQSCKGQLGNTLGKGVVVAVTAIHGLVEFGRSIIEYDILEVRSSISTPSLIEQHQLARTSERRRVVGRSVGTLLRNGIRANSPSQL